MYILVLLLRRSLCGSLHSWSPTSPIYRKFFAIPINASRYTDTHAHTQHSYILHFIQSLFSMVILCHYNSQHTFWLSLAFNNFLFSIFHFNNRIGWCCYCCCCCTVLSWHQYKRCIKETVTIFNLVSIFDNRSIIAPNGFFSVWLHFFFLFSRCVFINIFWFSAVKMIWNLYFTWETLFNTFQCRR